MSREINLTNGMRFGVGVDDQTEQVRGTAIEWDRIADGDGGGDRQGGQIVDSNVKLIESQASLMEAMQLSVSASVRYGMASGDAKFSLSQEKAVNQYSLYLLLKAYVRNPARHMVNARLLPEAKRVYTNDPEEFRASFGDTYIDEIYSGGDFFGLFIFETFDQQSRSELKAELNVSVGTFIAGGEIQASFGSALKRAERKSKMEIRCLMSGGSGLSNPIDINALKELYINFNRSVREAPVDYKASIKEFRYLPLPQGPTWAEQAVRRDVIEQCGKRIVAGIKLRSDIDFVRRFPNQFKDPPDEAALLALYDKVDAQLPRLAQRARECAASIERCSLEGMTPVTAQLPERLESADPIDRKWQDILQNDSHAAQYFDQAMLVTPITQTDRGPRGGKFKLFMRNGAPVAGIFWHPDSGAFGVYGPIMQEYLQRGHCEGPLGYPVTGEETVTGEGADGLDRIVKFENGFLWLDAQSATVRDTFATPVVSPSSFKSWNFRDRYIRHRMSLGHIDQIAAEDRLAREDATFRLVPGVAGRLNSFESVNYPGHFLRHENFRLKLAPQSDDQLFKDDATFSVVTGLAGADGRSFESVNFPGHYIRHSNFELWLARADGSQLFNDDATFIVAPPLT